MKLLIKIFSILLFLFLINCKKCDCVSDLSNKLNNRAHYKNFGCNPTNNGFKNFAVKYNSMDAYIANSCTPNNIPFDLGFNGIVLVQGVKVPYVGPNGGDPGYSFDIELLKDSCTKKIDFKFILTIIDTSRIVNHVESVVVTLNGIDSSYEINFSHEIIPYKE